MERWAPEKHRASCTGDRSSIQTQAMGPSIHTCNHPTPPPPLWPHTRVYYPPGQRRALTTRGYLEFPSYKTCTTDSGVRCGSRSPPWLQYLPSGLQGKSCSHKLCGSVLPSASVTPENNLWLMFLQPIGCNDIFSNLLPGAPYSHVSLWSPHAEVDTTQAIRSSAMWFCALHDADQHTCRTHKCALLLNAFISTKFFLFPISLCGGLLQILRRTK